MIDYTLYLVTGRELLPEGVDYYESLEESIREGGVSIVQLREKTIDTGEFLEIAKKSLEICDRYKVPMLINDNIAVALALPDRVGLHIGQTDLPISQARKLLGPNRILGHSVHNVKQAQEALAAGVANYVGVGPVYGTKSKAGIEDDDVLGIKGTRQVIEKLKKGKRRMPCVLIGGLNQGTAARALFGSTSQHNYADGIAVISAIVSRVDVGDAAKELLTIVQNYQKYIAVSVRENGSIATLAPSSIASIFSSDKILARVSSLFHSHREGSKGPPLIQTLTSHVSSTLSANIALAFSSSPIMSHQEAEADDLGKVKGAVVLNIGTIGEEARKGMKAVGMAANLGRKPIVLDPVGVGASTFRKEVVEEILKHTQVTLIKGNAAELSSIAGLAEVQSRGVDSGSGSLSDPESLVRTLAQRERCLVLLTGKIDYLSDGFHIIKIHNGHALLGRITGSGCALGVTIAAGMASACTYFDPYSDESYLVRADGESLIVGALLGILAMTIASELAAQRQDVRGPGSFIPALIDELASLSPQQIIEHANIEIEV